MPCSQKKMQQISLPSFRAWRYLTFFDGDKKEKVDKNKRVNIHAFYNILEITIFGSGGKI